MAGVLLAFQALVVVAQVATAPSLVDAGEVALGRDFLPFYTAGRIVAEGRGPALYDYATQARAQAEILAPARREGTAYFTNPAFFALPYALLAKLPYRAAFLLHAAIMAAVAVAGVYLLSRRLTVLRPWWRLSALVGLAWFPMANAVLGGQNPALSFALLAAAYVATAERRPWLAGVALGLLLYKPQFALPMLGLLLIRGELPAIAAAIGVGALEWAAGALAAGRDWPARMLGAIGFFTVEERLANGPTLVSLPEWFDYALGAPALGVVLAVALAGLTAYVWWRRADPARKDFADYWALAVAAMLLASPHTQHYDTAVLLLPVLLLLDRHAARHHPPESVVRGGLLAGFFIYPAFMFGRTLGVQPIIVLPLLVLAWAMRTIRKESRRRGGGA